MPDSLTVLGHTDLISEFRGDLRYLTVPKDDAQLTMVSLKVHRPLVLFASLCPYHYHEASARAFTPSETWQQWLHFRQTIEDSPSFHVLLPGEDEVLDDGVAVFFPGIRIPGDLAEQVHHCRRLRE